MTPDTPPTMRALRATYDEARQGREAAQALAPLLALLDSSEPGESGPLQEVSDLLRTILLAQERTLTAIEVLAGQVRELAHKLP